MGNIIVNVRIRTTDGERIFTEQPAGCIRSRCAVSTPSYLGSIHGPGYRRVLSTASMASKGSSISEWEKSPAEFDFRSEYTQRNP